MRLELTRQNTTAAWTLGEIQVFGAPGIPDGSGGIWTCEDRDRGLELDPARKVRGESAIPVGTYRLDFTYSARFRRPLPLLLDVPGFRGIRIHAGNSAGDTEGCILVGSSRDVAAGRVLNSAITSDWLTRTIAEALQRGEQVWLTIQRAPGVEPYHHEGAGRAA